MKHETIAGPLKRDLVLAFIMNSLTREHVSPTLDEIGIALGFGKGRAKQLVDELVERGFVIRTYGAVRNLRIVDVARTRNYLLHRLQGFGMTVAEPLGDLQSPYTDVQLPKPIRIRHLPDE